MTTWTRQEAPGLCGRCGVIVHAGDPIFVYRTERWRKVRCEACAGPAPPDLPMSKARSQSFTKPMVRIGNLKPMFDARMAAVGREPGSDD